MYLSPPIRVVFISIDGGIDEVECVVQFYAGENSMVLHGLDISWINVTNAGLYLYICTEGLVKVRGP